MTGYEGFILFIFLMLLTFLGGVGFCYLFACLLVCFFKALAGLVHRHLPLKCLGSLLSYYPPCFALWQLDCHSGNTWPWNCVSAATLFFFLASWHIFTPKAKRGELGRLLGPVCQECSHSGVTQMGSCMQQKFIGVFISLWFLCSLILNPPWHSQVMLAPLLGTVFTSLLIDVK